MAGIDKYGNLVADTGGFIGLTRLSGESDANYIARGEAFNSGNKSASSYNSNGEFGKSDYYSNPIIPKFDPTAELQKLKQAQLAQTLAGLDKQKNASLSNLATEKATIEPQYQKQKIAAGVTAKQTARSFDEFMAQRGSSNSGIAGQGTLMNNIAYQGQRGALDQGEATAIADNARRVTDVGNAYESDVAGANAGVEAQYLQAYINQMNTDRAYQQAQDQFNKNYGLQEKTTNANVALSNAQLLEMTNPNSVTNQMAQIGLDTARLNYTALPEQLKLQAEKIVQDLQLGKISIQTAQTQLDYLPLQMNAEIQATNRSNTGNGGESSTPSVTELNYADKQNAQQATSMAFQELQEKANQGWTRDQIIDYMYSNAGALMSNGVDIDYLASLAKQAFTFNGYNKTKDGQYSDVNSPLDSRYK